MASRRSLDACHKTFLSGSKISDRTGNYLGSKGKWLNSCDTFFHAFGYNTKDNLNISTLDLITPIFAYNTVTRHDRSADTLTIVSYQQWT